jgi:hypothetical protein
VNVRDRQGYEQDAMRMFERIKAAVQDQFRALKPAIEFRLQRYFFRDLRTLTRYFWYPSWDALFEFMLTEGANSR